MRLNDFKKSVILKVAERAGYICSSPMCNNITIGPDFSNSLKSTKTGIACHINAASISGPRYDASQTPQQRESIENAIWLCANCSILIDKNNGNDYPAQHLLQWKKNHEKLIKACLEGDKRIISKMLTTQKDVKDICRNIIKFLENRGVLFMPFHHEVPMYVFESIKEIRTFLTSIQSQIPQGSPLEIIVDSIAHACRLFMNNNNSSMQMIELSYSLGAMRKIIGVNLKDMSETYQIKILGPLQDIMPIEPV